MSRRRGRPRPAAAGERTGAPAILLAAAVCAALLVVDPAAEESFESPKRAAAFVLALAAAALAAKDALRRGGGAPAPAPAAPLAWAGPLAGWLFAFALAAGALAAVASPAPGASLAALGGALLFVALVPIGAAVPGTGPGGALVIGAALAGCSANAALALVQAAGLAQPFAADAMPGRTGAWGLLGNEGLLACVLSLGVVGATWAALEARRPAARRAAACAGLLCAAAVPATRNLTALAALPVGVGTLLLLRGGRRAAVPLLAAGALLASAALALPATRGRLVEAAAHVRHGRWDQVFSQRFGAWAAAAQTVRERPLLGAGPGSFAAQYVPRRLDAELRLRRRLPPPPPATTFGEAHAEPLDAAAAFGVPAALALAAAAALLLARLGATARDAGHPARPDALLLAPLLATGAVSALTWFPLQRTPSAVLLLLAAGRAWRIAGGGPPTPPWRRLPPRAGAALAAAGCVAALVPLAGELRRHAAERRLRPAVALLREAAASPVALESVLAEARSLSASMPHDPRPHQLAGAALLLLRRPEAALESYRDANRSGERAETDLNIGRAHALLDRRPEAFTAFVRAAWIAPHLVAQMPAAAKDLVRAEVGRMEALLAEGRLPAPPPGP